MKPWQIFFSFLFPATCFFAFLFLSGFAMISYSFIFSWGPNEVQEYRELRDRANPPKTDSSSPPYAAKQERIKSQKEILLTSKGKRLQLKLDSAKANLILDHQNEKTDLLEEMQDVHCFIQDKLYYLLPNGQEVDEPVGKTEELTPMQMIRYLKADLASYSYKSDRLLAKQVSISLFSAPGHTLSETFPNQNLRATGTAESVEFSLSTINRNFTANKLKATFYQPGKLL